MISIILKWCRGNVYINKIWRLMGGDDRGIGKVLMKWLYAYDNKRNDKNLQEDASFFKDNSYRVDAIIKLLTDERSKEIYKGMISFRSTMKYDCHPGKTLPQYFPDDIVKLNDDEVFLDLGGYDGETSVDFASRTDTYKRIVIFEPDEKCLKMIAANKGLAKLQDVTIIKKGAWNMETELYFQASGDAASSVTDKEGKGIVKIKTVVLDNEEICQDATFIKMDIEGAEMNALKGAEGIIIRNRPKLAICIYHSNEDMIRIIEYVLSLVSDYKVYVRQHSNGKTETVAYFIP